MFNRDIIKHVCFQQRVSSYSIFNVKHCKERKKKTFLALNFRLAVNMLQLIYALKIQQLTVSNAFPAPILFDARY
jgi:hypothetical protein